MSSLWVGIGIAALGAASTAYGANKQAKANTAAANTNAAAQDKQNQSAWASYLLSRGVNPNGAATGEIPTNPQPVNAKLPLWANASFSTGPAGWRKKGSGGAPVGTLAPATYAQPAPDPSTTAAAVAQPSGSSGNSLNNTAVNILNPLGIGGKNKNWYDPLGIF